MAKVIRQKKIYVDFNIDHNIKKSVFLKKIITDFTFRRPLFNKIKK